MRSRFIKTGKSTRSHLGEREGLPTPTSAPQGTCAASDDEERIWLPPSRRVRPTITPNDCIIRVIATTLKRPLTLTLRGHWQYASLNKCFPADERCKISTVLRIRHSAADQEAALIGCAVSKAAHLRLKLRDRDLYNDARIVRQSRQ